MIDDPNSLHSGVYLLCLYLHVLSLMLIVTYSCYHIWCVDELGEFVHTSMSMGVVDQGQYMSWHLAANTHLIGWMGHFVLDELDCLRIRDLWLYLNFKKKYTRKRKKLKIQFFLQSTHTYTTIFYHKHRYCKTETTGYTNCRNGRFFWSQTLYIIKSTGVRISLYTCFPG